MDKNTVHCEHGLRRRAVICDPCRVKRRAQQSTREALTERIRTLEAGLAEMVVIAEQRSSPVHDPIALREIARLGRTALAATIRKAGVFSGKAVRHADIPDTMVVIRDEHGAAVNVVGSLS